jgi:hypothetical protein
VEKSEEKSEKGVRMQKSEVRSQKSECRSQNIQMREKCGGQKSGNEVGAAKPYFCSLPSNF